jgi:hypothetical protein
MMEEKKTVARARRQWPRIRPRASWFHFGLLATLGLYFAALVYWFARLFLTGGTEEHVVMAIVLPVVVLVGSVSLLTFVTIALDGRKSEVEEADGGAKKD